MSSSAPPSGTGPVHRIRKFVNHPAMLLTTSGVMFATSLHEVISSAETFQVGAHHGVLAYAMLQAVRALPDLFESAERAEDAIL
jgi:hypothetical protein